MPDVPPRRAWAAVAVLALAAFIFVTTELSPIGLLTLMADDLGRSRSEIGLLVSGYAVVVVIASVPLTAATRRISRRVLLTGTLVVFATANLIAAFAPSYGVLTGARLVTALAQALFWSVVSPAVGGLFPATMRGRVLATFGVGPALAPVLGVPLATWLGQQAGWPAAFVATSVVGLAAAAVVVTLIPSYPPAAGGAARGTHPHRRRFTMLLIATAAGVSGFLTLNTYVTPFLLDVSHFPDSALAPLLFVSGAAGIIGTIAVGRILDAHPITSLLLPLTAGATALAGLFLFGPARPATITLLAVTGLSYSAFATAIQSRMLQLAPGSTDMASAATGTAFNAGIAAGSLLGGALLSSHGPRPLALIGSILALTALLTLAVDARAHRTDKALGLRPAEPGR